MHPLIRMIHLVPQPNSSYRHERAIFSELKRKQSADIWAARFLILRASLRTVVGAPGPRLRRLVGIT